MESKSGNSLYSENQPPANSLETVKPWSVTLMDYGICRFQILRVPLNSHGHFEQYDISLVYVNYIYLWSRANYNVQFIPISAY